jgi:hypothetical protein
MSTLFRAALAALALVATVSAASATFITGSSAINTDKVFDEIDRKAP